MTRLFPSTTLNSFLAVFASLLVAMLGPLSGRAATWQEILSGMPLESRPAELNRSNVVDVILRSFARNSEVKALVFMPGATDEFYFFRRARAKLDSEKTLFQAVQALTNQTLIRVTFRSPLLLLHTAEDPLEPGFSIRDEKTAEQLRGKRIGHEFVWNDRDWDFIHPLLTFYANEKIVPGKNSPETTHFFRHSMVARDLTAWELLEAISLANKTTFTVQRHRIIFAGDTRFLAKPPVPTNWWALPNPPALPKN